MNLLSCYVKSTRQERLIELLASYCGFCTVTRDAPVPVPPTDVLADPQQPPSMYTVNGCGDWVIIEVNSILKLHELGSILSSQLNTYFLQTIYCAVIEYAYLLLYHNGILIREIESKGYKTDPDINYGEPLLFEDQPAGQYFDLDTIADYCQHWGIDINNLFEQDTCVVLQDSRSQPVIRLDQEQEVFNLFYPLR
ncbi:hypothetical protein [Paraflavitalea sp. CAU 1676]|uniref:hypothetical protein n=1 Tax=Paraflavitalea sp. CAU 1676 TaxID=3032598 RepID=UPI0023DB2A83|nr:hypothetical protein [Paraflavitalea sp. CAU 1676]MDF2188690.1 hypothetical protein [Paraflavitalea sp. CAU 1676]